jgi:hypothetical protein
MVLYTEHAIRVLNLLGLEEPARGESRLTPLWEAREGHRLVAAPVLLQAPPGDDPLGAQERTAVWLTALPGQGFTLCSARLALKGERPKVVRRTFPDDRARGLSLADPKDRGFLVRTPFEGRDRVLLCLPQGVWLLDVLGAGAGGPVSFNPLLRDRRTLAHLDDTPGVVFVPGQRTATQGPDDEVGGRVFLACESGGHSWSLVELTVTPDGSAVPQVHDDYGGIPFDRARVAGLSGVVCLSGQALTLCDWLQHRMPLGSSAHLDATARAHVYGRLAVCSGATAEGGHPHWFAVLMDLERGQLAASLVWPTAAGHPVMLGRSLFTLENVEPGQRGAPATAAPGLHLVRREVRIRPLA